MAMEAAAAASQISMDRCGGWSFGGLDGDCLCCGSSFFLSSVIHDLGLVHNLGVTSKRCQTFPFAKQMGPERGIIEKNGSVRESNPPDSAAKPVSDGFEGRGGHRSPNASKAAL